jgi:hypothetical protein
MKNRYQDALALLGAQLLLLLHHTGSFLSTQDLAGRDLVGAYSLVESFGFGWSTDWFLGFPMFKFYPPGFFGAASTVGALVGNLAAFKLLVYTSLLTVPLAAYWSFSRIYDRETGLVAGILGVFLTFMREPFSLVYQTLQVGLVAQAAALPLLLLFIGVLWGDDRGSAYLSALLLGLMVLVHPFIAAVAVAYTGIYLAMEKDLFQGFMALTGLALASTWWIPAMEKSWYAQLYTGPVGKIANLPWLFLPFLALDRRRETLSLALLGASLALIGSFRLFPIQYYRAFIYGQLILVMAAAPGMMKAARKVSGRLGSETVLVLIGFSILAAALSVSVEPHWQSHTSLENVTPENGQVLVETSEPDLHESYVPVQRIPLESNATVVNGLYADSSISSPYLLGLEKAVAEDPVPNPLAVEAELSRSQVKQRMAYLDIEHALVRTRHARERLSFMKVTGRNQQFVLLSWEPEFNRTVEKPVRFSGNRGEWRELNERIFRGQLNTSYVFTREDIGRTRIGKQSIKPSANREAVFGLRLE